MYENQGFFFFQFWMSFQLTSLSYYQVAQAKKQTNFGSRFKKLIMDYSDDIFQ
jgi:hypothetical protein